MKAFAVVYLCFFHKHRGIDVNYKPKPAVRPEPHSQVPSTLANEQSKSALHRSSVPLPNIQLFHSMSASAAPFWAIAKATWFSQPGKEVIRLKVLGQIQYIVLAAYKRLLCSRYWVLRGLKRW